MSVGCTVMTRHDLLEQTFESRQRNVRAIMADEFDKQFGLEKVHDEDRLADLGLVGTSTSRLSICIAKHFPFITDHAAADLIVSSATFSELVDRILRKVGA